MFTEVGSEREKVRERKKRLCYTNILAYVSHLARHECLVFEQHKVMRTITRW